MTAAATAEERARSCLEEGLARPLSDEEWRLYSARLLAYVRLLQSWERAELS
jgi:hypothetical protein